VRAVANDAFSIPWQHEHAFACPPWAMISQALVKAQRTVHHDPRDTILEIGDLVPNSSSSSSDTSNPPTEGGRSRNLPRRVPLSMDSGNLASQRQRLSEKGASEATLTVFTESPLAQSKDRNYSSTQRIWIAHCKRHNIDFQDPLPMDVINYLVEGRETRGWKVGTINAYRSAILNIIPTATSFWNNPVSASSSTISRAAPYEISPIHQWTSPQWSNCSTTRDRIQILVERSYSQTVLAIVGMWLHVPFGHSPNGSGTKQDTPGRHLGVDGGGS